MPYDVNNYAYICIGNTPIAEVKETESETEIACWNGNGWDEPVTTNTVCGETSVIVGSATTECNATMPECCDECGVCDFDESNDGNTCRVYTYGTINIDLCPDHDDITFVWEGDHNIKQLVDGQFVGDPLTLDGADANGFVSDGENRTLSAATLSSWENTTVWGCTLHDSARITVTCNEPETKTCETASTPQQYQRLGCCKC